METYLKNFSKKTQENINLWLDGISQKEKKILIENIKNNPEEIEDAFSKKLSFGTAGIRAKMGLGTNRLNIYIIKGAALALANHLKKNSTVIIGYDNRHNSKIFAKEAAKVLAYHKINVFIFKTLTPTPLVSFGCRFKKCAAAIMITASHNTKEYNGFKVYAEDGSQIVSPQDQEIIAEFNKIQDLFSIKTSSINDPLIHWVQEEIENEYLKILSSIFSKEKKDLKILYTPLHGTGITILPKALKQSGFTDLSLVQNQSTVDENFSYAPSPNPENKEALELGIKELLQKKYDIFIATDPDADRLAATVLYKNIPYIFNGNQIACILAFYILKNRPPSKNGAFIKSIVTTELFRKIVLSYKQTCFDVLTGFKYIAEKIRNFEKEKSYEFIFGAEESLGFLYKSFVRDKDSIISSLLLLEAAFHAKKKSLTLVDILYDIYKKYGIYRQAVLNIVSTSSKMDSLMKFLREKSLKTFASYTIRKEEDYLKGIGKDLLKKITFKLNLPKSNVIRYFLEDGTSIVIRPSGTEPKIKIYLETFEENLPIKEGIKICDERLNALLEIIKQEFFSS